MNEDVGLPKATILNLIKEFLVENTRISNEANDVILQMSSEFVNHLSSISNDICLENGKKTISQGHVAEAMKKLKIDAYLAKIMNVGDSKELEGMTEKKKKEMLNSSLNVTRKKKKGISKEQEEELRKKQALLFQQDQQLEMLPSELQRSMSSPPSVPHHMVVNPNQQVYQPNEPKFYDGSITQVLNNPEMNPAMSVPNTTPAPLNTLYPNHAPAENRKEEVEEEIIVTTKQAAAEVATADIAAPSPVHAQSVEDDERPDMNLKMQQDVSVADIQRPVEDPTSQVTSVQAQQVPTIATSNQFIQQPMKPNQPLIQDEDEDFS